MTRARIRTLKPEVWQDEKVVDLSRDARLLFVGLITMADDEGRLRAPTAGILGHVFPHDDDAVTFLATWLDEIVTAGLILRYRNNDKPYIAFRHWRRHQKINRPTKSTLPPPPNRSVARENAVPADHGAITEVSVNVHGEITEDSSPRAQARVPIRSVPIPSVVAKDQRG